jgi:hypothetical protein
MSDGCASGVTIRIDASRLGDLVQLSCFVLGEEDLLLITLLIGLLVY